MANTMAGMQMGMMMGQQMINSMQSQAGQIQQMQYQNNVQPQGQAQMTGGDAGVAPKFCPNCGTKTEGAKFCSNCGTKLI
jgi:membrane protease subunit (stomatin/prohibitin family)